MIKFDPNKAKTIGFDINVVGIDPKLLEYNLRISSNNIHYGFSGTNENGTITFVIPPLNEIIKHNLLSNISKIKLEVNDKNNKYYIKPYEDDISIKEEPEINISIKEEKDEMTESLKVDAIVKENIDIKDKEANKTAFKKFLSI